ncbi:hypothetical protein WI23_05510 [Burkholderia oklahomensis C6786]|nr:hypothetical protein WI23_05510 [Burkholderia oklahomensis C6786]KUY59608.1 hypothetical protein WI23_16295 [Burkholderia oklahomensis C6786]
MSERLMKCLLVATAMMLASAIGSAFASPLPLAPHAATGLAPRADPSRWPARADRVDAARDGLAATAADDRPIARTSRVSCDMRRRCDSHRTRSARDVAGDAQLRSRIPDRGRASIAAHRSPLVDSSFDRSGDPPRDAHEPSSSSTSNRAIDSGLGDSHHAPSMHDGRSLVASKRVVQPSEPDRAAYVSTNANASAPAYTPRHSPRMHDADGMATRRIVAHVFPARRASALVAPGARRDATNAIGGIETKTAGDAGNWQDKHSRSPR